MGWWKLGEVCRVTMSNLRVTIGHHRVTMGHLRVTMGHLRVTVVHIRVTLGHLRVTIGFFSISKHKANPTELHPKVRQTCFYVNCNTKSGKYIPMSLFLKIWIRV